jgi:hypothetical protein
VATAPETARETMPEGIRPQTTTVNRRMMRGEQHYLAMLTEDTGRGSPINRGASFTIRSRASVR